MPLAKRMFFSILLAVAFLMMGHQVQAGLGRSSSRGSLGSTTRSSPKTHGSFARPGFGTGVLLAAPMIMLMGHQRRNMWGLSCFACNTMNYSNESDNLCRHMGMDSTDSMMKLDLEHLKLANGTSHQLPTGTFESMPLLNGTVSESNRELDQWMQRHVLIDHVVYNRTLYPNDFIQRRQCASDELYCSVRSVVRYEFVGDEIQSKFWMLERNCSKTCNNDCMLIGDRHRLRVCNSCCKTADCNLGGGASATWTPAGSLLVLLVTSISLAIMFANSMSYRAHIIT